MQVRWNSRWVKRSAVTAVNAVHLKPWSRIMTGIWSVALLFGLLANVAQASAGPVSSGSRQAAEIVHRLEGGEGQANDVALSADGAWVAAAYQDGSIWIWSTEDGDLAQTIQAHSVTVNSLDFSPDGTRLASGGDDRRLKLWDVSQGRLIWEVETRLIGRVLEVTFSPDGALIALGGHFCFAELRQANQGILRSTLRQPHCVSRWGGGASYFSLDFAPDGQAIASGEGRSCCGGSIQVREVDIFSSPQLLKGYQLKVRDLQYSPGGETLAVALVGGYDFWLLDAEQGALLRVFEGHAFRVNSVDFSPDGTTLLTASHDRTLRLWDADSGETLAVLPGHQAAVLVARYAADGSLIASAAADGEVILWTVNEEAR